MQHNKSYTFLFVSSITIIASLFLATAYTQLKDKQDYNVELDRKKNILGCLGLDVDSYSMDDIINAYEERIEGIVSTLDGEKIENVKIEDLITITDGSNGQSNYMFEERQYIPIYHAPDSQVYIFPISGKGLWSTLYGYFALENDFNTVKGITFYKHKETAGLGGEIEKPWFRNNFEGKHIFSKEGELISIKVTKGKVRDVLNERDWAHAVDGISGATITSNGVTNLLHRELIRYHPFIKKKYKK